MDENARKLVERVHREAIEALPHNGSENGVEY